MADPSSRYESLSKTEFIQTLDSHFTQYFTRQLAHSEAAGHAPQWIRDVPGHQFLLETHTKAYKLLGAFSQLRVLIRQATDLPPQGWLERIGSTEDSFRQQCIDLFTTVLYSVLDRALLLLNVVYGLEYAPRECHFRVVHRSINDVNPTCAYALVNLRDAVEPVADHRHFFVHRGDSRELPLFTAVRRMRLLTKEFGIPTEGLEFNAPGADAEVIDIMRGDVGRVGRATEDLLNEIHSQYANHIGALGDVATPTTSEVIRAATVVGFFQGGPEPRWWVEQDS